MSEVIPWVGFTGTSLPLEKSFESIALVIMKCLNNHACFNTNFLAVTGMLYAFIIVMFRCSEGCTDVINCGLEMELVMLSSMEGI